MNGEVTKQIAKLIRGTHCKNEGDVLISNNFGGEEMEFRDSFTFQKRETSNRCVPNENAWIPLSAEEIKGLMSLDF